MYNFIIHDLYIVLCAHHPKSNVLPSSYILAPATPYQSLFPLLTGNHNTVVCVYQFLIVCFSHLFISLHFLKIILLLFNYSCLHFLHTPLPHPNQTHLPPLLPPSGLVLSTCPLQQFLKTLLPTVLSAIPSGYCQIILNFNVSGYILCAFFFCWLCSS